MLDRTPSPQLKAVGWRDEGHGLYSPGLGDFRESFRSIGVQPSMLSQFQGHVLTRDNCHRGESHSGHSALMGKVKCELEMISGSALMEMTSPPRWLIFWVRIRESSTILQGGATRIAGKPIRRDHSNGIVHDLSVLLSLR